MYCDLWLQYIKVRKLFKGGNYSRAKTICGNTVFVYICLQVIPKDFLQQLLVWMRIFLLAQENQIMPNQITIVPMNFTLIVANVSILILGKRIINLFMITYWSSILSSQGLWVPNIKMDQTWSNWFLAYQWLIQLFLFNVVKFIYSKKATKILRNLPLTFDNSTYSQK